MRIVPLQMQEHLGPIAESPRKNEAALNIWILEITIKPDDSEVIYATEFFQSQTELETRIFLLKMVHEHRAEFIIRQPRQAQFLDGQ